MAKGKNAKVASRKQEAEPVAKDDGRRYVVKRDGRQVYPGPGVSLAAAEELAGGLAVPARIVELAAPAEEETVS